MPIDKSKNFSSTKKDVSQEDFDRNLKNSLADMKDTSNVVMPKDSVRDEYFDAVKKTAKEIEMKLKDAEVYPYKRNNPKVNDGNVVGRNMKVDIWEKDGVKSASLSFGLGGGENPKGLRISLDENANIKGVFVSTDVEKKSKDGDGFYVPAKFRRYEDVDNIPKSFENICNTIGFANPEREQSESDLTNQEITMRMVAKEMGAINKTLAEGSTQRMSIGDAVRENGELKKDENGKTVYQQLFENVDREGNQLGYYFTIHNKQNEQVRVYLDMDGNINHINYNDWNGYNKDTKEWDKGCKAFAYDLRPSDNRITFGKFTEVLDSVVAKLGDKYIVPEKADDTKEEVAENETDFSDIDVADIPFE